MKMKSKKNEWGAFCSLVTETENIRDTKFERKWYRDDLRGLFSTFDQKEINVDFDISQRVLVAGERSKLELRFKNVDKYLKTEGHILVYLPVFWGGIRQERDPSVFIVDKAPRTYNGYISANINAVSSNPDVELGVTVTSQGSVNTAVDIVVVKGELKEDDCITLYIGDDVGQLPRTYEYSGDYRFCVAVDGHGTNEYIKAAEYPIVTVKAKRADRFSVHTPADYEKDNFKIRIAALDEYKNKSKEYNSDADVYLIDDKGRKQFVESVYISSGYTEIKGVCISDTGTYKIAVVDILNGISGISNPFVYRDQVDKKIVFGEIHCHTELSDGVVSADEAYLFGKENIGLDFAAISDHMDIKSLFYDQEERWRLSVDTTNKYNCSHNYVTLIGQEWTGRPHMNVYFKGDKGMHLSSFDEKHNTPEKLWDYLGDEDAMTIIHHPKYLGKEHKWDSYNQDFMRLAEIYSGWGSSEYGDESALIEGLDKNYIFGFTGGTDNHIGKIGMGDLVNDGNGITAAIVDELTREKVFEALYERHCYATTGAKILLKFSIDDNIMGDVVTKDRNDKRVFNIEVIGTFDIENIAVVKNGKETVISKQNNFHFTGTWEDQYEKDQDYYYLKVTQKDGHTAWSSPIWIKVEEVI